jgi:3-dehydroquinate synthase
MLACASRIDVEHAGGAYPIFIEPGLIHAAAEMLAPYARNDRLIIVSDGQVWAAQGPRLRIGFAGAGIALIPIIVAVGEQAKSWSVLINLIDRLIALGVERTDTIVAFGGGVVGDLTGFAASILKRGCTYIQIPTTLLAQVDSSVGGKTGINVQAGKNLVGAFHHPAAVLIDPTALDTLPERQVKSGYAEIVKYGLIGDAGFFNWCEAHGHAVIAGDLEARIHAIRASVAAKARIVAEDERETSGARQLLNFGHTFGHALEAETRFGSALLHGEAVAIGMKLAFGLSVELGICGKEDPDRVSEHFG